MSMIDGEQKPAILCLHGGGTSGTIFNIQTIRLRRELSEHFDFVFVDGPFEVGAGPNVLPVFEGAGPFLGWRNPADTKNNQASKQCVDIIRKAVKDQYEKTKKHFVALMGFSEGARMAAGIALDQQLQRSKSADQDQSSIPESEKSDFLFGIYLMGTSPPLTVGPSPRSGGMSSFLPMMSGGSLPVITLPSVHVIGLKDPWKDESREMATKYFDSKTAKIVEFDIGHHLPTVKAESVRTANAILNLYHGIIDNM